MHREDFRPEQRLAALLLFAVLTSLSVKNAESLVQFSFMRRSTSPIQDLLQLDRMDSLRLSSTISAETETNNGIDTKSSISSVRVKLEQEVTEDPGITLVPLSQEPLLLSSSSPLVNREECDILIRYIEFLQKDGENTSFTINSLKGSDAWIHTSPELKNDEGDEHDITYRGQQLLERVKQQINALTNCEDDPDEDMLPRVLEPAILKAGDSETRNEILPNRLHVDNVNDKRFRHISAILYLTDEMEKYGNDDVELVGGATTFPLATRFDNTKSLESAEKDDGSTPDFWRQRTETAAKRLIQSKIYHTALLETEGKFIDQTAVELFQSETGVTDGAKSNFGVRMTPASGRLCVFHNLLDDGTPNPMVFHGAEAVLGRRKAGAEHKIDASVAITDKRVALVFFKEVPGMDESVLGNDEKFLKGISEARKWFIDEYY